MPDLTSPGAAFAAQARMESALHAGLTRAVTGFLEDVEALARRESLFGLTPAAVSNLWALHTIATLDDMHRRGTLTLEAHEYVVRSLTLSSIPNEAYDSARAVLLAAQNNTWSQEERDEQLALALRIDTPAVALVAAAKRRPVPEIASVLGEGGPRWSTALDSLVQTAATGLHGMEQYRALVEAGFGAKRWVSRRDAKVRLTHTHADGQVQPLTQAFSVGSSLLMWPGEWGGAAGEVINCRCVVVGVRSSADPLYLTGDEFA